MFFSGHIRKGTFMATSDYMPDALVAARYKVTTRTIDRWDQDPDLEFPEAMRVNGRKYRSVKQLELWERRRAASPGRRLRKSDHAGVQA